MEDNIDDLRSKLRKIEFIMSGKNYKQKVDVQFQMLRDIRDILDGKL